MNNKTVAGFAAALTFAMTTTIAGAAGPGGGGVGNMRGIGSMNFSGLARSIPRGAGGVGRPGAMMGTLQFFPFPVNDPNHYHEIKLIGRVAPDESGISVDQQIVRMGVDGRTIPMSINGDLTSNSLQLDQGDELGQNLYRLILSKRLVVVGDQKLRTQLTNAASADRPNSKPILVDGFVYDRMTPYLVLVSVGDAP